ncbi:MAG: ribosome silencing factor [Archangiaceae bacterium]|nr:ribosome silencing factor [Archangiaceae bacterium]
MAKPTKKKPVKKKSSARASKSKTKTKKAPPKRAKRPSTTKKKIRPPKAATSKIEPNEKARALAQSLAAAVIDKMAADVVILDVRGRASYADYIVVASGESDVQLRAMADGVHEKLKAAGVRPVSSEGEAGASWVLLDYGDVVAHFFDAATRSFYDLEGMWADAPREAVS